MSTQISSFIKEYTINLVYAIPVWGWLVALLTIAGWLLLKIIGTKWYRHKKMIRASYRHLTKLQNIEEPDEQITFLQRTNPTVFEEMILSAFKNMGYKIYRNFRYTGDCGIDGRIMMNGRMVLIQAKRYKSYINAKHVEEFVTVCRKHNCRGLFVHTGLTGERAKNYQGSQVDLIDQQRMLDLLNERNEWKSK